MTARTYQNHLMDGLRQAGGMPESFEGRDHAYLMVHGNEVYRSEALAGLDIECTENQYGVDLGFRLKSGVRIDVPVYICFGIVPESGRQDIAINGVIEDCSAVEFMAYCVFPNARKIVHNMKGNIRIGDHSGFKYTEAHYHGTDGGIEVNPRLDVCLGETSQYDGNFYLTQGRAGRIRIDYGVDVGSGSTVSLLAKVRASGDDDIHIDEKVILRGNGSKGTVSTRIVGSDISASDVTSVITAFESGCLGHVDCIETLLGQASARATPIVDVRHKDARVTHEAAIGSLNSKQLEALMARGLTQDQAIDMLVSALMK